jgi:predicted nucleic acid-binding Zn finger protein
MLDMYGESRQQRGLEIAAVSKIERKGQAWLVPSQSGKGRYTVIPDNESPHCSCPDHADGGHKCKHLFAVEYVLRREKNPDGSTTFTETMTVQKTVQRVYRQDWRAYNAAQTNEKAKFQELLRDLCGGIAEPPHPQRTRRRSVAEDVSLLSVQPR